MIIGPKLGLRKILISDMLHSLVPSRVTVKLVKVIWRGEGGRNQFEHRFRFIIMVSI